MHGDGPTFSLIPPWQEKVAELENLMVVVAAVEIKAAVVASMVAISIGLSIRQNKQTIQQAIKRMKPVVIAMKPPMIRSFATGKPMLLEKLMFTTFRNDLHPPDVMVKALGFCG